MSAPVAESVQQREVTLVTRRPGRRGHVIEKRETVMRPLEVLDTAIWGPSVWRILHAAESTPLLATAIHALNGALPCPDCRAHYRAWLESHPLAADTDLCLWLLDLHNDVNARTGKTVWTVEDLNASPTVSDADLSAALAGLRERIGIDGWRALAALVESLRASEALNDN